jgi:3-oxoacyl-[acyl-carrier-protein] synthase-3
MLANVQITNISYYLPEKIVTNSELATQNPSWEMSSVEQKAGVYSRHIAAPNETAFDLALHATKKLFQENDQLESQIDGIIFCTQSPDYIMPSNSHLLHAALDLKDNVLAFDYNLACSGYIYGLALASSLIQSRLASTILLVTADTYSKHINPKDRSARVLFGDGAAVSVISANDHSQILAIELCTHGKEYSKFYIPAGGMRLPCSAETKVEHTDRAQNVRTKEQIHMDGLGVWSFINSAIPPHINKLLDKNNLTLDKIDQFIFHQASQMTLDSLTKVLKVDPTKVYINMKDTGNLVSASIPVALSRATSEGKLKRGDLALLCGFGVGLSYGSVLIRY